MSHQFENECDKQSLSVEGNVVTQSSEQTTKDNELFTSGDNLHDNNKVIPFGNIIRNSDDRTMINDVINIPHNHPTLSSIKKTITFSEIIGTDQAIGLLSRSQKASDNGSTFWDNIERKPENPQGVEPCSNRKGTCCKDASPRT